MRTMILFGSPRKKGNTFSLLRPFIDELEKNGSDVELLDVYESDIAGCKACFGCQKDKDRVYCIINDDMQPVLKAMEEADLIVVAAPIHSFGLPGPVKTAFDRSIYPFLKYYGDDPFGPSHFEGKTLAVITTCGYPVEKATPMLDDSMRLIAKHCKLNYAGMLAERQRSYRDEFMTEEKEAHAREFARKTIDMIG